MEKDIREWLLEEKNPELRLRVLKEGLGYDDDSAEVIFSIVQTISLSQWLM